MKEKFENLEVRRTPEQVEAELESLLAVKIDSGSDRQHTAHVSKDGVYGFFIATSDHDIWVSHNSHFNIAKNNALPHEGTIEGHFGLVNDRLVLRPYEDRSQPDKTFANEYEQSGLSETEFNNAAEDAIRNKIYSFFKKDFEK